MAIPIIDSHLDLAWNAVSFNRDLTLTVAELRRLEQGMTDHKARGSCTTSLPELRNAPIPVCVATLLARGGPEQTFKNGYSRTDLDFATQSIAYAAAHAQLAYYQLLEKQGHLGILRTSEDLADHWQRWQSSTTSAPPHSATSADAQAFFPLGMILSMEGADPGVTPDQPPQWVGF